MLRCHEFWAGWKISSTFWVLSIVHYRASNAKTSRDALAPLVGDSQTLWDRTFVRLRVSPKHWNDWTCIVLKSNSLSRGQIKKARKENTVVCGIPPPDFMLNVLFPVTGAPVLLSLLRKARRCFEPQHSDRFVIIVMDGMSEFDWNILSSIIILREIGLRKVKKVVLCL